MHTNSSSPSVPVPVPNMPLPGAGTAETFITLLRADPVRVVLSVLGLVRLPFLLLRG